MPFIFCAVTQRTLLVPYRRFGIAVLLKMGLISCPEMSVYKYEQALCNISDEPRPSHPLFLVTISGRNQTLGKNQYICQYIYTLWDTLYDVCQLLHVSAPRCFPQRVITTKVYKPTCASLGSAAPHGNYWS